MYIITLTDCIKLQGQSYQQIYIHICISDNNKQKYTSVCMYTKKETYTKYLSVCFVGISFLTFNLLVFLQMPANNRSSRNLKSHFFLLRKGILSIPNLWECIRFERDLKFKDIQTGLVWKKNKQNKSYKMWTLLIGFKIATPSSDILIVFQFSTQYFTDIYKLSPINFKEDYLTNSFHCISYKSYLWIIKWQNNFHLTDFIIRLEYEYSIS